MHEIIGKKAPAFKLFNTEKKEISSENLKGTPFVLLFFPLAFTGTCTKELCTVRDDIKNYESLNARMFGISVDSVFALAKCKDEYRLNFELLSDFNKEISKSYGCLYDDFIMGMKGVSKRAVFVVDAEGIVCHAEILENAGNLPDFEKIKLALQQIAGPC